MSRKNHHPVLIAGAGPAGLAAALFLRERDVEVEIVDPGAMPSEDQLAVVLHRDTMQRLADAGVTFDAAGEARTVDQISIYERDRWRADVDLAPTAPVIGSPAILPRWLLCKKLDAALHRRGVKVAWNHRLRRLDVADDRVYVDVDAIDLDGAGYAYAVTEKIVVGTQHREPAYLIAADGRDSVVRTQLHSGWTPLAETETIAAFELETSYDAGHQARIVIGPDASTSVWPLPGRAMRITFHLPGAALRARATPDADDLTALLRAHAPGLVMSVAGLRRAHAERVTPAIADRPNVGRAWLLGDAARVLPPAGSLPLNQGIDDAHCLAAALAQTLREHDAALPLQAHAANVRAAVLRAVDPGAAYRAGAHVDPFIAAAYRRILPLIPARGPDLDDVAHQLGLAPAVR